MTLRKTRRRLYRAARLLGDVDAAAHPRKAAPRAKNRIVGRLLGKAGVWAAAVAMSDVETRIGFSIRSHVG